MGWGGIKRDSLDANFSRAVRERACWRCQKCEREFPVGERGGLHCSHYFSRRNRALRYHPLNAFSLCMSCHRHFTENPDDHREWVAEKLGPSEFHYLRLLRNAPFKFTPDVKHYVAEKLKRIVEEQGELRMMGWTDPIPFASPYPEPGEVPNENTGREPVKRPRKKKAKKASRKIQSRPFPKVHRPLRAA